MIEKGTDSMYEPIFSADRQQILITLSQLNHPLLAWYHRAARVLPWRSDPTPYHVWLSEIMLQQTRVEAVLPYYQRFLAAIPDIPALAAAPEEQLHKLWEGLGYYSRVRNLQKAARQVMERYDGLLPPSYELLLDLCGIGEYTAGAIASIAFGIPVPAVDGNVLRVLSRLFASEADISLPQVKKEYRELLLLTLPQDQPGDFNQAMMEIGATVCLPNGAPKCGSCPLQPYCRGFQQGNPTLYPVKAEKKPRRIEEKTVFLLCSPEGVLIRRRPPQGLLAGLWEFPHAAGRLTRQQAETWLTEQGISCTQLLSLREAKHIFTHIEWHMTGYFASCTALSPGPDEAVASLRALEEDYAVPNAFAAYKKALSELLTKNRPF